jgi:RNA polymerase sigma-70 factor, ECF subfamily
MVSDNDSSKMEDVEGVTVLLNQLRGGDRNAEEKLFRLLYSELRRLAGYYLRGERSDHTLQPTALVNEAYVRLVGRDNEKWANRAHFIGVSARIMRCVLVDYARAAKTDRRSGGRVRVPLDENIAIRLDDPSIVLDVDAALCRLAALDERQAHIVELRYFAGLSVEEVADHMKIAPRTIKREWACARAWLHGELHKVQSASHRIPDFPNERD